jgi:hypothetical protein
MTAGAAQHARQPLAMLNQTCRSSLELHWWLRDRRLVRRLLAAPANQKHKSYRCS